MYEERTRPGDPTPHAIPGRLIQLPCHHMVGVPIDASYLALQVTAQEHLDGCTGLGPSDPPDADVLMPGPPEIGPPAMGEPEPTRRLSRSGSP